jgi:hypothetical protein
MTAMYAQNVGAVVRSYDERAHTFSYVPRAETEGGTYNFTRIVGICYAVRLRCMPRPPHEQAMNT